VKMMHPLAGQTISMTINVVGVRAATAAEQEAGRAISAPPPPPPPKK
jgi:FKBP-type peptidyl-prolyl cis-trans isomerase 2